MPNNLKDIAPKSGQLSNGQPITDKCVVDPTKTSVGNSNKPGINSKMLVITSNSVLISEEVVPSMLMVITMPPKNTISGGLVIGTTMVS